MDINDLNRRIRYALSLGDADVCRLLALSRYGRVDEQQVAAWRLKPDDEGFEVCPLPALNAMLEGLIVERRGPPPESQQPAQSVSVDQSRVDNNHTLKQLRIALSLRTEDVWQLINAGGGSLGKTEVSALFRKSSARNYRRCGDQVLRWFLAGLAKQRS